MGNWAHLLPCNRVSASLTLSKPPACFIFSRFALLTFFRSNYLCIFPTHLNTKSDLIFLIIYNVLDYARAVNFSSLSQSVSTWLRPRLHLSCDRRSTHWTICTRTESATGMLLVIHRFDLYGILIDTVSLFRKLIDGSEESLLLFVLVCL